MVLTWHRNSVLLILFSALEFFFIDVVTTQEIQRPWYENLPAVAMDYKVRLDAGKEDCYHQYVIPGAAFYVSFSVVRGGDGFAGFMVRNPAGAIVKPYEWQQTAEYTDQVSSGGYYAVCIDNQYSAYNSKLVNLYITVVKYDEWDKYAKEIEELNLNMHNFTEAISSVEHNINDMITFLSHSRHRESRDFALLLDNYSKVQNISIIHIFIILVATGLQVYFVREMFKVTPTKSGRHI